MEISEIHRERAQSKKVCWSSFGHILPLFVFSQIKDVNIKYKWGKKVKEKDQSLSCTEIRTRRNRLSTDGVLHLLTD